jgi:hypothetical protein
MSEADAAPEKRCTDRLATQVARAATRISDEIRNRHGDAIVAVLFYGSCMRKKTAEGVLDFYALVDEYSGAYSSRPIAWLNTAFPPNVFYLEFPTSSGLLRAKYAVISTRDFARAADSRSLRSGVWARFCQPFETIWTRDEEARIDVVRVATCSAHTAAMRILPLLPRRNGETSFTTDEFWQALFAETYAAEMRAESEETIQSLYRAAPEHFTRTLASALESLANEGWLEYRRDGDVWTAVQTDERLRDARMARRLRRPLAKLLAVIQLLKSACTFGDWLPYALWKLERHTGTRLTPTERQRRHPFLFGWPLILRVLRKRELR